MNPDDIDMGGLRGSLREYGNTYPEAYDDTDIDVDLIGGGYQSDKYSGGVTNTSNNDNQTVNNQQNTQQEYDEDMEDLGYKQPSEFGGPQNVSHDAYEPNEQQGHFQDRQPQQGGPKQQQQMPQQHQQRASLGINTILMWALGAVIAGAIGYFIIQPMLAFALRSAFNIQPQWYDNYEDITNKYFSEHEFQTEFTEPLDDLKNIRGHISDTFTEVTGIDLDTKMKDGKTILRVPFVVGHNDIRTSINGAEYAIDVPSEILLTEGSYNRAEIELSIMNKEIQGIKFLKFVRVLDSDK